MGDEASTRAALDPSRAILRLTYPDGSVRVFDEDAGRAFGRMDWSRAEWIGRAEAGGAPAIGRSGDDRDETTGAPGFAARFRNLRVANGSKADGFNGPNAIVCDTADGMACVVASTNYHFYGLDEARAFVAGLHALDVLREIEWEGSGLDHEGRFLWAVCPACEESQSDGHAADCRLAAVLDKATGEERS